MSDNKFLDGLQDAYNPRYNYGDFSSSLMAQAATAQALQNIANALEKMNTLDEEDDSFI